jgi:hypothetical protein
MQNSESLKWERYILDLIYDTESIYGCEHSDSPDFLLSRDDYAFGVEITELFRDGSSARLVKIPDYMQRLWSGSEPVHKDDVTGINVVTLSITDETGKVVREGVKAIFSEVGSLKDHSDVLAAHIERKNEAYEHYDHTLGHINLIVGDHFASAESIGTEYSTADFFTPRLRAAIRDSPFREIALIINILFENAAWVPLRELELMESFHLFVYCVYQSSEALEILEGEDIVHLFALEMESLGWPLSIRDQNGREFAARGNVSVVYAQEGGTQIHEHDDRPTASVREVPRRAVELPDGVWEFIKSTYERAREDGAGVELAYVRPVRDALWPFAQRTAFQRIVVEPAAATKRQKGDA